MIREATLQPINTSWSRQTSFSGAHGTYVKCVWVCVSTAIICCSLVQCSFGKLEALELHAQSIDYYRANTHTHTPHQRHRLSMINFQLNHPTVARRSFSLFCCLCFSLLGIEWFDCGAVSHCFNSIRFEFNWTHSIKRDRSKWGWQRLLVPMLLKGVWHSDTCVSSLCNFTPWLSVNWYAKVRRHIQMHPFAAPIRTWRLVNTLTMIYFNPFVLIVHTVFNVTTSRTNEKEDSLKVATLCRQTFHRLRRQTEAKWQTQSTEWMEPLIIMCSTHAEESFGRAFFNTFPDYYVDSLQTTIFPWHTLCSISLSVCVIASTSKYEKSSIEWVWERNRQKCDNLASVETDDDDVE